METRRRARIYLTTATMMLTAALAMPAAAQQVPFKGALEGHDTVLPGPSPTTVIIDTEATGTGTHLGQFSLIMEFTADLVQSTAAGSARWTAANGDSIDTTMVSSAEPADSPEYLKLTEVHTITGGTGRFTGAQGSFVVERLHKFAPDSDGRHATFGGFHGTVTPPGHAH